MTTAEPAPKRFNEQLKKQKQKPGKKFPNQSDLTLIHLANQYFNRN